MLIEHRFACQPAFIPHLGRELALTVDSSRFLICLKEAMVRTPVISLLLLCLIPWATAQQPDPAPTDPDQSTIHVGVPHHYEMIGQFAPDVTFAGKDGTEISLDSYRGRPLVIDFWATWCAPCLKALPSLSRIYAEFKGKGLEFITFDEEEEENDASGADKAVRYLAQHYYNWKNFHDDGRTVAKALQCDGLPLVVLIDANGAIVYFDFGGHDADLRKAIASLGPDFAPVSPPHQDNPDESSDPPHQN